MKNRLMISLLLFIACTPSLKGMNKKTQDIVAPIELPELPYDMINEIFTAYVDQSFTPTTNAREARKIICAIRNVNKCTRVLITAPKTTRKIISQMSQNRPHQLVAEQIGTPEALAYIRENMFLRRNIFRWSPKTISQKVATFTDARHLLFADANFLPIKNKPLLFLVQSNIRKIKMLFSCGADPNAVFKGKTLLQVALEKGINSLADTILAYKPQDKCLDLAIDTDNLKILRRILQRKNVTTQELNEGLRYAIKAKKIPCMELFLQAGVSPNPHLLKSFTRLLPLLFDEGRPDCQIFLDIIHTLCLYGACDKNVDDTVYALRDRLPERLIASLQLGKEIAQANEKI